jgi:hypothetical protein
LEVYQELMGDSCEVSNQQLLKEILTIESLSNYLLAQTDETYYYRVKSAENSQNN